MEVESAFKGGALSGQGTLRYSDGRRFVGEFKRGQRLKGTFTWPNGDEYVGEFRDGSFWNGHGTVTLPDGTKYVGSFRGGERQEAD